MSVGKRITEAIDNMVAGDAEAALIPVSIAVDATAAAFYGMKGRSSYKQFIADDLGLITRIAGHASILNLSFAYSHHEIKTNNSDGTCTIGDVLYHAVRCGLLHEAKLPSTLHFVDQRIYSIQDGHLYLPASFVNGLIASVVVSPVNAHETAPDSYGIVVEGSSTPLAELWGRKDRLVNLMGLPAG